MNYKFLYFLLLFFSSLYSSAQYSYYQVNFALHDSTNLPWNDSVDYQIRNTDSLVHPEKMNRQEGAVINFGQVTFPAYYSKKLAITIHYRVCGNWRTIDTFFESQNPLYLYEIPRCTAPCNAIFGYLINPDYSLNLGNYQTLSSKLNLWDFGNNYTTNTNLTTYRYPASGNYQIKHTVIDSVLNCIDSFSQAVSINYPCNANFKFQGTLTETTFKSTYSYASLKHYWDFGDGTTASGIDTTHSYSSAGTYQVRQIIVDTAGSCTDTVTKSVWVSDSCKADFQVINSPLTEFFGLIKTGITSAQSPTTYIWEFAGNRFLDESKGNFSLHYPAIGNYDVKMILQSGSCTDSITKTIQLGFECDTPVIGNINYTFTTPNIFLQVNQGPPFADYAWRIQDSVFKIGKQVKFKIDESGDYEIWTYYSTPVGCNDSIKNIIHVNLDSTITIDTILYITSNTGLVSFETNYSGYYDSCLFDFGDGISNAISTPNTYHWYEKPGNYVVTLSLINKYTKTTKSIPVLVTDTSICKFNYPIYSSTVNDTMRFSNSYTLSEKYFGIMTLKYFWDFGDAASDSTTNNLIHHHYINPGYYKVKVVLKSPNNLCYQEDSTFIKVSNSLSCNSNFNFIKKGPKSVLFSTSGAVDSLIWDFGDGTTSNTPSITHNYSNFGRYVAQLRIYKPGCADTMLKMVDLPVTCEDNSSLTLENNFTVGVNYSPTSEYPSITFKAKDTSFTVVQNKVLYKINSQETQVIHGIANRTSNTYPICKKSHQFQFNSCGLFTNNHTFNGFYASNPSGYDSVLIQVIGFNSPKTYEVLDTLTYYENTSLNYDAACANFQRLIYKVIPFKNSPLSKGYIPSYMLGNTRYNGAFIYSRHFSINLSSSLEPIIPDNGSYSIEGITYEGSYLNNNRMANVQVNLYDTNFLALNYTYSLNDGTYKFDQLSAGSYLVLIEFPGLESAVIRIDLGSTNPTEKNRDFEVFPTYSIALSSNMSIPENLIQLFPNPSFGNTTLINSSPYPIKNIQVFDAQGKILNVNWSHNSDEIDLETCSLKSGVYFLRIESDNRELRLKFIKN